jgi:hypothetical protein
MPRSPNSRPPTRSTARQSATGKAGGGHPPQPEAPAALARVRALCAGLPGLAEKTSWGAPTLRAGEKMFAMLVVHHHDDPRVALWCAAPPGAQAQLVERAPERVFVPPYVGYKGWIGLDLAANDDTELAYHLRLAYRQVAPKKLLAQLAQS